MFVINSETMQSTKESIINGIKDGFVTIEETDFDFLLKVWDGRKLPVMSASSNSEEGCIEEIVNYIGKNDRREWAYE